MSISSDLPTGTDHPTAGPPIAPVLFECDPVGNMESRTVAGVSYTLTYDAENRLIGVVGGGPTVTFTYDGNRVKKDEDGVVTHYPGRHYEATVGSGSTKYYYADGQLAAFERSPEYGLDYGLRYVFRDHLGSTSVIVNGRGEKLWEDRYLPGACPERRPEVVSRRDDVRHTFKNATDMSVQTGQRYTQVEN